MPHGLQRSVLRREAGAGNGDGGRSHGQGQHSAFLSHAHAALKTKASGLSAQNKELKQQLQCQRFEERISCSC